MESLILKSHKSKSNNRVSGSEIQVIDSVIRYKAVPFTGIIFYNYDDDDQVFSECDIVDGLKEGVYKEFYSTGELKFEALYEKNKLIKITAF